MELNCIFFFFHFMLFCCWAHPILWVVLQESGHGGYILFYHHLMPHAQVLCPLSCQRPFQGQSHQAVKGIMFPQDVVFFMFLPAGVGRAQPSEPALPPTPPHSQPLGGCMGLAWVPGDRGALGAQCGCVAVTRTCLPPSCSAGKLTSPHTSRATAFAQRMDGRSPLHL